MTFKRIQLGLIHVAVTITLVPINSTLNRIMIKELALSAFLVAVLVSLPYLFSPIQVAIGSFSDKNPLFGFKRSPYIAVGLLFCVAGVIVSPYIAYLIPENYWLGVFAGVFVFGAWGMGYNLASVSYFALATEISGEARRSRTIAVMFFMMIVSIILTSLSVGGMLEEYTVAAVNRAFLIVGAAAFAFGVIGLVGLEKRSVSAPAEAGEHYTWKDMFMTISSNKQATRFFWYLLLLLTAILGQDILLEPYGAEAFNLSVKQTTRITSIWGTFFLISLSFGGMLERKVSKIRQAKIGAWSGVLAFALIVVSSLFSSLSMFYVGVVMLGLATGLATVSNLSLMLDMTTVGSVGLFIGAWGMASALARLVGNLMSGIVRQGMTAMIDNPIGGYSAVFVIELVFLLISLVILRGVDVSLFQQQANSDLSYVDRAVIANEV